MYGYPPSPAVETTKPHPPVSPADKIPTNKEQELVTIQTLNKRLKTALDKDKNENADLEQKRRVAKDVLSKARQELDKVSWTYSQGCDDLLVHKNTWASTETDLVIKDLHNNDTQKYVDHLHDAKTAFVKTLNARIAKKQAKLDAIEKALEAAAKAKQEHLEAVDAITAGMQGEADGLKQKMVGTARLENDIREANHVLGIESYHATRWAEKCDAFGDLDPSAYAHSKEARSIRAREQELESRFQKIYDGAVTQMIEQHRLSQDTFIERQKQSAAEKQTMEAQMKDLKNKKIQQLNDITRLEQDLAKTQKEVQTVSIKLQDAESAAPVIEKDIGDVNDKIGLLQAELKKLSQKVDERERNCAVLAAAIKDRQEASAKAKQEEEAELAAARDSLQRKKILLEEATIGLLPEISKYRGLVDVVEVKLTPQTKRHKRTTL